MKRIVRFIPAIVWFLLSFYLLTLPGKDLPQIGWFEKIHGDKFVHIGMFAILVAFMLLPLRSRWPLPSFLKTALLVAIFATGYGIAMEFVQECCIPNRSFDVFDMVADGGGSFLPVVIYRFILKNRPAAA